MSDRFGYEAAKSSMLDLRVFKVENLDREQLISVLQLSEQHLIVEGTNNSAPIVMNPGALDEMKENSDE